MKTSLELALSIALATAAVWAQAPAQVVQAKVTMAQAVARADSVIKADVEVEILPGYHINDNHPTLDYLIPTEVKLDPIKEVIGKNIFYPKGELKKFAFSDTPLSVYEGKIRVEVALQLDHKVLPGDYEVKGKLGYQACNDHACLPPTSVPLSFPFKVAKGGASASRASQ